MSEKLQTRPETSLSRLQNEKAWYESFLVSCAKGESVNHLTSHNRVQLRLQSIAINKLQEATVIPALVKIIADTFDYFSAEYNENLVRMLIDDILGQYGRYSAVEIIKAFEEGRRTQGALYGRFSAQHIMNWLSAYDAKLDEDLAQHHQNAKYQDRKELDSILAKLPIAEVAQREVKKRDFTNEEIVEEYMRQSSISPEEHARREHMRNWSAEQGDLETYMKRYDDSRRG